MANNTTLASGLIVRIFLCACGLLASGGMLLAQNHAPDGAFDAVNNVSDASITPQVQAGNTVLVTGWAVDPDNAPLVDGRVEIWVDGVYRGAASYGSERPDVAGIREDYRYSGWIYTFSAPSEAGDHSVVALVINSRGEQLALGPRGFNVPPNHPPDGAFDAVNGISDRTIIPQLRGGDPVIISGWAADPDVGALSASNGRVEIWVDGTHVGDASVGSERPDVAGIREDYRYSGWIYNFNATSVAGDHSILVKLFDTNGAETDLEPHSFAVIQNNPPEGSFDAINGVTVGATIPQVGSSDTVTVAGWAADPDTGSLNGRVEIWIDGVHLADAPIISDRPDVAGIHGPGYLHSGWAYTFNANYSLGTHSVAVVIFDDQGASASLGTATFAVVSGTLSGNVYWIHDITYTAAMGPRSEGSLPGGGLVDEIHAGPAVVVDSGANIIFAAGQRIRLQPGFRAAAGSVFKATVDFVGKLNKPEIFSSVTARGMVSVAFNYQIRATNNPFAFGAGGLPSGLSINGSGLISGAPAVAGRFSVTLSAGNGDGTSTRLLSLLVLPSSNDDLDSDSDGVPNGIERQLGTDPGARAQTDTGNTTQLKILKP